MADTWVVRIRRIMQASVEGVAFYEGAVRHSTIRKHKPPFQPHKVKSSTRIAS